MLTLSGEEWQVLTNAVKEGGGEERLLIKYICDIISASIENNPGGDDNYNLLFDYINNKRHHSNNNNNNVVNARKVGGELPFDSIATELGKTVKFLTHPQDIENLSMVSKEFTAVLRYDIDKAWKYLVKKILGTVFPIIKRKSFLQTRRGKGVTPTTQTTIQLNCHSCAQVVLEYKKCEICNGLNMLLTRTKSRADMLQGFYPC